MKYRCLTESSGNDSIIELSETKSPNFQKRDIVSPMTNKTKYSGISGVSRNYKPKAVKLVRIVTKQDFEA
jgi:hypothetical protein